MTTTLFLGEIAALLGCPTPAGAERTTITGVNALADAGPTELTFVGSEKYVRQFARTRAAAVIVHRRIRLPREPAIPALAVDDADRAVARLLERFAPPVPRPPAGIDPSARVAASATVEPGSSVGPHVVIGERAVVGQDSVLHAGVYLGDDVTLGERCELFPHVVVRERITLGRRVVIHAGSVLGTDGFGYRWDGTRHAKVPQIGTVIVGDDVEIGSCVCIDRARFGATTIGPGTKIDNLVQVGHNVRVGPHCIIVGQAGLAGSVELGAGVVLGGQAAVRDHVRLGDGSTAAACSAIAEDVDPKSVVSGMPALPHRQSLREQAALRRLPDLVVQVRKLQDELATLRNACHPPDRP